MGRPRKWTNDKIEAEIESSLKRLIGRRRSSAGIARVLNLHGIKGKRYSTKSCPIARWLKRDAMIPYSARSSIKVGQTIVTVRYHDEVIVKCPPVLELFISRFDAGHHSEVRGWAMN